MCTHDHPLLPDYFAPAPTPTEAILRRIKGDHRRALVRKALEERGPEAVPAAWTAHALPEAHKNLLAARSPRLRGGEDLPDLEVGEVEIARLSLRAPDHGKVTSLRAQASRDGNGFRLRLVDELGTTFGLAQEFFEDPLTAEEVAELFDTADPCPTDTTIPFVLQSFFYPDLDRGNGARD